MSAVVEPAVRQLAPAGSDERQHFRPDIEGLRAVAVLLVLAYHAGLPFVGGGFVGVDVFFVISGFLITGLMLREVSATGRLSIGRFYARRIRRLLPATAVVLAATAVLTVMFLPPVRWSQITGDIAASATYVVNWRLAGESVDYLASESAPSPVQHFWSLAVEEQFYIVWPLLILALVWWSRRSSWSLRRTMFAGLALIAVPSFLWSVYLTGASAGQAYFVSTTRAWELAIGAVLAIGAPRIARLSRPVCAALAWAGLMAIAWAAFTYDVTTAFPGYAALLPTLGAAAVIAAGIGSVSTSAGRLLGLPPMRDIGALSYSLYLWHWPLLVAATAAWGELTPLRGTLVTGFSVVPAWLTYRMIESPIHHARSLAVRPVRAFGVGAAATAIGLTAAVAPTVAMPDYESSADAPGAAVLDGDPAGDPDGRPVDRVVSMTPDPLQVRDDNADVYDDGCHQNQEDADLLTCAYGDVDAERVIALVGDSHAAQWQPTLDEVGARNGWRVETYTKSSCGFFSVDVATVDETPYTSCSEWNAALLEHLTGPDRPDVVVASGSNAYRVVDDGDVLTTAESRDLFADGLRRSWQAVLDAGVELAVLRNTPWLNIDVPECISENPEQLTECAPSRDDALDKSDDTEVMAAEKVDGLEIIDLNAAICPTEDCAPVIGNVVVWRDPHHLTATYARTLASRLDAALEPYLR